MMNDTATIRICQWAEVSQAIATVNPLLSQLIEDCNPTSQDTFIRVKYFYGQPIFRDGQLQLPVTKNQVGILSDSCTPAFAQKQLGYSRLPVGVLLNKSAEIFYENEGKVTPTKIMQRGALFGLWEMFDRQSEEAIKNVWSMVAGSRTAFMLPKISDRVHHQRLRNHFAIASYPPANLLSHQQLFTEINQSARVESPWYCEVIFFSKAWQNKTKFLRLHHFWLHEAWRQSLNCRDSMSFSLLRTLLYERLGKRNIKPKPYTINTIKHLISVLDGLYPAYAPAINDDTAPVSLIKSAYQDVYQIKTASPIVMEPVHLASATRPVYYSPQLPSLFEYAEGMYRAKNIITELKELKLLLSILESVDPSKKSRYQFFHQHDDDNEGFLSIHRLVELDKNFPCLNNLSYGSPFLRGCVQINLPTDRKTALISAPCYSKDYTKKIFGD